MPINIKLQDFTATIHQSSRYNNDSFDLVHVESLIVTDEPIPNDTIWYIPNSKIIDPVFQKILQAANINPQPTEESLIQSRIDSFGDAVNEALSGDSEETKKDITTLALLSVLSKPTLRLVEKTYNTYLLSYDYKLLPISNNTYELKVQLPFPGFIMPDNGDKIQITVVTPMDATIDKNNTNGIDENGNSITPQYANFPNSRKEAISFDYSTDPTFTIRYSYQ